MSQGLIVAEAGGTPTAQLVYWIVGVPVAVVTTYAGWYAAKKTRLEIQKMKQESQKSSGEADTAAEARATFLSGGFPEVAGYVVRFILLYLTYEFWNLFVGIFSSVVSLYYATNSFTSRPNTIVRASTVLPSLLANLVNVVIFVSIGYPLLRDILKDFGITRRMFWIRDRRLVHWDKGKQMDKAEAASGD